MLLEDSKINPYTKQYKYNSNQQARANLIKYGHHVYFNKGYKHDELIVLKNVKRYGGMVGHWQLMVPTQHAKNLVHGAPPAANNDVSNHIPDNISENSSNIDFANRSRSSSFKEELDHTDNATIVSDVTMFSLDGKKVHITPPDVDAKVTLKKEWVEELREIFESDWNFYADEGWTESYGNDIAEVQANLQNLYKYVQLASTDNKGAERTEDNHIGDLQLNRSQLHDLQIILSKRQNQSPLLKLRRNRKNLDRHLKVVEKLEQLDEQLNNNSDANDGGSYAFV